MVINDKNNTKRLSIANSHDREPGRSLLTRLAAFASELPQVLQSDTHLPSRSSYEVHPARSTAEGPVWSLT
jgi:hypothetical protein